MVSKIADVQNEQLSTEEIIQNRRLHKQILFIISLITVEPLFFLYTLADSVRTAAVENLRLEKACIVSANFNTTVCNAIITGTYKELSFIKQNDVVQLYATSLIAWTYALASVLNITITLFLGAYSDRHKIRIPFMLVSIFGELIANGGTELCAVFMQQLPLEVYGIFANVIASLFGGWTMMYTATFAYVTDISTPETCTFRLALLYGVLQVSVPIGTFLGGVIFKNTGYTISYSVSSIIFTIAFIYGALVVKEPRTQKLNQSNNKNNLIADMCDLSYALAPFQLLIKMKGHKRMHFLCILFTLYIIYTIEWGEFGVLFLFAQGVYQWTVISFSTYITITSVMQAIGVTLGVYILKTVFKLSNLTITLIGLFDILLTRILFILIKSSLGLYMGELIGIIRRSACVALRAQSTQYVSDEDTGKAQSMIACIETLGIITGALVYNTWVYGYTQATHPYAIFIVGIGLAVLATIFPLFMYFTNKKTVEQRN